ncbi:MAG TPA: lysylphosphatidylglycerol synthase domain-containing protein, partial [Gemmatimonadaceae bacterium]|nr:lysylphosphatidylglycerol synthase domain-containing protein [Gemmatimonadaceae bacterium]
MPTARRSLFLAAQWIFAAAVVWFAIRALRGQWANAAEKIASIRPAWGWIGIATVIVIATYALLIETWRLILRASGERLSFGDAARIWVVSNLGKYVPGKVWSIAAMTVMARNSQVSPAVAAGSSVVTQLVSVAAGIGVVLLSGARSVEHPVIAVATAASILLLLAAIPVMLPALGRAMSSVLKRKIELPSISQQALWMATGSSLVAWIA